MLQKEKKIIEYKGLINHSIINKLVKDFTEFKDEGNISNSLYKKIIVLMVEMLENSSKYSKLIDDDLPEQLDLISFTILQNEKNYTLISSNFIKIEHVQELKSRIDEINSCDKKLLKELYLKKLIEGIYIEKNSPGVGLIRMAKISRNKINCSFNHFDNKLLNYTLQIRVSAKLKLD